MRDAAAKEKADFHANWQKANPDLPPSSFEKFQKLMEEFESVIQALGVKAMAIQKQIQEIMKLMKGNMQKNFNDIV
jgi:hypothetical protein